MFAIVTDNEITKFINHPKSMVIGDVRYPAKIFQLWSTSELNAIGIYEVVFDDSNKKDEKWYINTNQSFDFDEMKLQLLMVLLHLKLMQILYGHNKIQMMEIYLMTKKLEM